MPHVSARATLCLVRHVALSQHEVLPAFVKIDRLLMRKMPGDKQLLHRRAERLNASWRQSWTLVRSAPRGA